MTEFVLVSINTQNLGLDQALEQSYLLILNFAADSNLTLNRGPAPHLPSTHTYKLWCI